MNFVGPRHRLDMRPTRVYHVVKWYKCNYNSTFYRHIQDTLNNNNNNNRISYLSVTVQVSSDGIH